MVLGATDDGSATQCYFMSSSTSTPCAPSPPAVVQPPNKAQGKKRSGAPKVFPGIRLDSERTWELSHL
eukprot:2502960-Prorocentrum_lima.AAC.1